MKYPVVGQFFSEAKDILLYIIILLLLVEWNLSRDSPTWEVRINSASIFFLFLFLCLVDLFPIWRHSKVTDGSIQLSFLGFDVFPYVTVTLYFSEVQKTWLVLQRESASRHQDGCPSKTWLIDLWIGESKDLILGAF